MTASAAGALDAADLLRQLVYLPQASMFVAEARREVVGGAVLALRPSVAPAATSGTVDLLVVDPDHDVDRVTMRSSRSAPLGEQQGLQRRRGGAAPDDPAELTRWERRDSSKRSAPPAAVAAVGAAARRR